MAKSTFPLFALVLGLMLFGSSVQAQERQENNGRRDRERREWDPTEYLRRIDANKNGHLDPGEMQGRMKDYIRNLGFKTDKPLPISEIVKRSKGDRRDRRSDSNSQSSSQKTFVRKVPGFGVEQAETADSVSNFSTDGSTNNPVALRRKYGESVMIEIQRSLDRYDKNGDKKLDANEIRSGRWGRPRPEESDLNKDGQLSLYELAERYKQRNTANNGDNRNNDSRNRGDDSRNRDNGGSSDARSRAREAAEKAAKEREAERRKKESDREREDTRDSNARARARAAAEAARRDNSTRTANFASGRDRYETYAKGTMKKYDKNGDGVLDKDEIKGFRRPPANMDANKDGKVTYDELLDSFKAKDSSSERKSPRQRSNGGSVRSFSDNDQNGDGKIKMVEYADKWTQDKIREFQKLDRNNDGMLSEEEFKARDSDDR